MSKMKYAIVLFIGITFIENSCGMSEAQLKAAVKMVRNVCQPKSKATNEDIDKMHSGNWEIDHTGMCYVNCALSMYKLIGKDNKLDYQAGVAQLKQLPESRRAPTLECITQCKDSAKSFDDKCTAAFEIAKCVYFCNPENYFLP